MTRNTFLSSVLAVIAAGTACVASAPETRADEVLPARPNVLFWTPEETQVGFRRTEDVLPTRTVARGSSVRMLPESTGPGLDVQFEHEGRPYTIDSFMEAWRLSGVLVLEEGKVRLERYGLGRRPEDRWQSFSITKSVTSTLIGAAIADGHIQGLDEPLERYIAELRGTSYEGVSIRQLLTMTSGVAWNEDYDDPDSDVARAGVTAIESGDASVLAYMRTLGRAAKPGERFNYSTGETDLAGYLLSRATGMTLSEYLSKKIWAGYGMEHDAVWVTDRQGHERGGCCLAMTLRDYARFGQLMLDNGAGVTPEGWVADATSRHVDFDTEGNGYGYFWWVSPDAYTARGIFGQWIRVEPETRRVIVINSAARRPLGEEQPRAVEAFIKALRAAL